MHRHLTVIEDSIMFVVVLDNFDIGSYSTTLHMHNTFCRSINVHHVLMTKQLSEGMGR